MRRSISRVLIASTLLFACGGEPPPQEEVAASEISSSCPSGVLCRGWLRYSSEIGMWYTLWWMPGGGGHWGEWSRYRPLLGYYQSGGRTTFPTERSQFETMKLDFLILDHTNGLGADGGNLDRNGRAVVTSLDARNRVKQSVAAGGCLWLGDVTNRLGCMRAEANALWTHYANPSRHGSSYRFRGKPLHVSYTAPGAYDTWSDARYYVGSATGRTRQASANMRNRGLWGWVFDDPSPIHPDVMGVTPGWNTAHLGHNTTPLPREPNGMRFQRQWLRAIKRNPRAIVISSWNDFGEETAIQPAVRTNGSAELWRDSYGNECPNFYYDIARVYSLLRWGLAHGAYVKDENRSAVYRVTAQGLEHQTSMPRCAPVVNLPAGDIDNFPVRGPQCVSNRGRTCTIPRSTDFGSFCWDAYTFNGQAIGYRGCSCRSSARCGPGQAICSCAGPTGRVNCAGQCALSSTPLRFGNACWPAYSFDGGDMGMSGCSCASIGCPSGQGRCQCRSMPGVPVCRGDC